MKLYITCTLIFLLPSVELNTHFEEKTVMVMGTMDELVHLLYLLEINSNQISEKISQNPVVLSLRVVF